MCKMHILLTSCALWFVIFCSKVLSAKCIFIFFVLSSCLLSSLLQVQFFSNALCVQCILWGENVSVFYEVKMWTWFEVWVFFVRCEHVRLKVSLRGHSLRLKVWGWSLKVWSLKSLCQVQGLRCEAHYEVKGLRLEVWSWRSKVEGMRYEVFVSSWRFEINGLKCEVLCQRLEVSLCKVKGWRYLCARSKAGGIFVWGQRSKVWWRFELWKLSLWGMRFKVKAFFLRFNIWAFFVKFDCSLLFVKSKDWTFMAFYEV